MKLVRTLKTALLFVGDIATLYLALILTVIVRYGGAWYDQFINQHAGPFTLVFCLWIAVFYIAGLYDLRHLRNNLDFIKVLALALVVNAVIAVGFFYALPSAGISPKTNLFAFMVVFAILEVTWRRSFNRITASLQHAANIVVVGGNSTAQETIDFLEHNAQFGYRVASWIQGRSLPPHLREIGGWRRLVRDDSIELIVVPRHLKHESKLAAIFFQLFSLGVEIKDLPAFYEFVFRKIPLSEVNEEWFLENVSGRHRYYDDLKHAGEFAAACLIGIMLSPLILLIVALVALSSPGPVIYRQVRIGKNGREFVLYKFRTMRVDAEKDGPQWASTDDARSTPIGRALRYTHLDELPQLVNIVKGELSFVGPRPERPEFVKKLRKAVPYYDVRHLIKPGITGWAQIHYRKDATIDDVTEKLQHDIYYLKNRSPVIDIAIILKTIKTLFATPS